MGPVRPEQLGDRYAPAQLVVAGRFTVPVGVGDRGIHAKAIGMPRPFLDRPLRSIPAQLGEAFVVDTQVVSDLVEHRGPDLGPLLPEHIGVRDDCHANGAGVRLMEEQLVPRHATEPPWVR